MLRKLRWARTLLGSLSAMRNGFTYASQIPRQAFPERPRAAVDPFGGTIPAPPTIRAEPNPLESYFDGIATGPGILKWRHYFDAYHRHLAKFVGKPLTVVEVGIYSGGSLPMWRNYFGPQAKIVGIDIEPACKAYETEGTRVFIGDQADRSFWATFRREVPRVDVLIDDGGHKPEQQRITLEEMLPHLQPGGVYICEDIHDGLNDFASFVSGLTHALNEARGLRGSDQQITADQSKFQDAIHSIHHYPFLVAIEKREAALGQLVCPKHGTQWQPFL